VYAIKKGRVARGEGVRVSGCGGGGWCGGVWVWVVVVGVW